MAKKPLAASFRAIPRRKGYSQKITAPSDFCTPQLGVVCPDSVIGRGEQRIESDQSA
jgi:hypothetical protein